MSNNPTNPFPIDGYVAFMDAANGGRLAIKRADGTVESIDDIVQERDRLRLALQRIEALAQDAKKPPTP